MNTRLQVEHPVTEMITGLDLVEWQLRVAAGEPLPRCAASAGDRRPCDRGADLCRGSRSRLPAVDRPHRALADAGSRPRSVRVDTGFREGDDVSPFYDPLLAKVIAWGEDRERARAALLRALDAMRSDRRRRRTSRSSSASSRTRRSRRDSLDTGLIDAHRDALLAPPQRGAAPRVGRRGAGRISRDRALPPARRPLRSTDPHSPWHLTDAWWNGTHDAPDRVHVRRRRTAAYGRRQAACRRVRSR